METFREKLRSGRKCLGPSINFNDPLVTEALADSVDFFWIDLEHSNMSNEALNGHLLAARAKRVPAIVRVKASATPFIKPVLDAGADGIIVPQVCSAEEVRSVVSDCRYPPLGQRGFGPRVPSNYGREGAEDYLAHANENMFVAVQIENTEALASVDEIVQVPGLDSLVVGPFDLSLSMGKSINVRDQEVISAIKTIVAKARAAGLFIGVGVGMDWEYARLLADCGMQWLHVGEDHSYLVNSFESMRSHVLKDLDQKH
jgi:2-keto-3-deoxy-L-rhamnonate aldolase RhmA